MVSLNKSFLWGIIFASFTWTTSLYLYWQLSSSNISTATSTFMTPSRNTFYGTKSAQHRIMHNEIDEPNDKKKFGWKNRLGYKETFFKKYHNSDKLIKSLQPVAPKDNTLDDPSKNKNC